MGFYCDRAADKNRYLSKLHSEAELGANAQRDYAGACLQACGTAGTACMGGRRRD